MLTNHVAQVSATPLCPQRGQGNKCPRLTYDGSSSNFYHKLSTEEINGILRNEPYQNWELKLSESKAPVSSPPT